MSNRAILFAAGIAMLIVIGAVSAPAAEFFIAPNGSDANPGTEAAPFATLEAARDAVRASVRDASPAVIWLRGGDYTRTQSFELSAADTRCIYRAMPGETPRLCGGRRLDASWFTPVTSASPVWGRVSTAARGNLLEVNLAAHGITNYGTLRSRGMGVTAVAPMELSIDGRPQVLGRYPNAGSWSTVASTTDSTHFAYSGTRPTAWSQAEEVWFHGYFYWLWADFAVPASGINTTNNTVTLAEAPRAYGIQAGQPYFAFNLLEEIDTPGEYYINRSTGMLYFWPNSGFANAEIVVSEMENPLIRVAGASDITVDGITMLGCRGELARVDSGTGVTFSGCRLLGAGSNAVSINGTNNGLDSCEIVDAGSSGVRLDGGTRATLVPGRNYVSKSSIHGFSRLSFTYLPGVNMAGVGQTVKNCEIHSANHSGIMFSGNEHLIEYNDIHDVCQWTGDASMIYCGRDWGLRGNVIRYNFLHDSKTGFSNPSSYAVNGVYLDDCASGVTVFGNIFYRVQSMALFNAGGRDNNWQNNIVARCGTFHHGDTRGTTNINNTAGNSWNLLERIQAVNYQNPPWSTAYPALAAIPNNYSQIGPYKTPGGTIFSRNISWLNGTNYDQSGSAFNYYAQMADNLTGQDPMFANEASLDLNLQAGSPAFNIPGFQAIPFNQIGIPKVTWDADAETSGAQDGNGVWVDGGADWWDGEQAVWHNSQPNGVTFGSTSGTANHTITLGSDVTVRDITFQSQNYSIVPDAANPKGLALYDTPTITTVADATLAVPLTGTGFIKNGAGRLTLTAPGSYSDVIRINAGTLALSGGDNRLPITSIADFAGTSTLDAGSTSQTLANLTVANGVTGTVNGTNGTLTVSPATFQLGGTTAATQTLNMAGLTAFAYNNSSGTFTIGGNPTSGTAIATATLTLASTNTITTSTFNVARGTAATTNPANVSVVNLGQTNTINADSIMIGGQSRGNGKLQFQANLTNPELLIRGTSGGSSRANLVMGNQASAAVENTGVVDLTTGVTGTSSLNAMVGTLTVGQNSRGSQAGGNTSRSTGTFTMGGGTLDATTIVLGQINSGLSNSGASSYAHGTFTLGGGSSAAGEVKVGTLTLGDQNANTTGLSINAIFNLNNGGTLKAQTIQPGATVTGTITRTFTWNDGTIKNYDASTDLTINGGLSTFNLTGTGLHAFDISSGRVGTVNQSTSGNGKLTKLGNGRLVLASTHLHTGTTAIDAGTLWINGSLAAASNVTVAPGATLGGTGTAAGTIAANGMIAPGNSVGTLATGTVTFGANGSLVTELNSSATAADKLAITGALNISSTSALSVTDLGSTLLPVSTKLVLVTYTGAWNNTPFAGKADDSVVNVGANSYIINYNDTDSGRNAVTLTTIANPFTNWISQFTFAPGADTTPSGDPDHDGIFNGVEMVLGGHPANTMDAALMPTLEMVTNPGETVPSGEYLVITYRRTHQATDAGLEVYCEYNTGLGGPWSVAVDGQAGVKTLVDDNYASFTPPAANTDRVRVYIPRGANTRLFGRLKVVTP